MRVITSVILTFIIFPAWSMHPTHMSIVNIDYTPRDSIITYSIRVFQDDIIILLTQLYHKELFHSNQPFDLAENTQKVENYFDNNLEFFINNVKLQPQLINIDSEEIDYWLHYSITITEAPKNLTIRNTILTQLYSDQTNLVIFAYKNKEKGLTFGKDITEKVISLE